MLVFVLRTERCALIRDTAMRLSPDEPVASTVRAPVTHPRASHLLGGARKHGASASPRPPVRARHHARTRRLVCFSELRIRRVNHASEQLAPSPPGTSSSRPSGPTVRNIGSRSTSGTSASTSIAGVLSDPRNPRVSPHPMVQAQKRPTTVLSCSLAYFELAPRRSVEHPPASTSSALTSIVLEDCPSTARIPPASRP